VTVGRWRSQAAEKISKIFRNLIKSNAVGTYFIEFRDMNNGMRVIPFYKPQIAGLSTLYEGKPANLFYEDKDNSYTSTLLWGCEVDLMLWVAWNVAMARYLVRPAPGCAICHTVVPCDARSPVPPRRPITQRSACSWPTWSTAPPYTCASTSGLPTSRPRLWSTAASSYDPPGPAA
jgi:hypothetical protein